MDHCSGPWRKNMDRGGYLVRAKCNWYHSVVFKGLHEHPQLSVPQLSHPTYPHGPMAEGLLCTITLYPPSSLRSIKR